MLFGVISQCNEMDPVCSIASTAFAIKLFNIASNAICSFVLKSSWTHECKINVFILSTSHNFRLLLQQIL